MPVIIVDTEQAQLIEVALAMLEGALTARVQRVDPEQVISKALNLQALKLATVRRLLARGEPPEFAKLEPALRRKAEAYAQLLATSDDPRQLEQAWQALRGLAIAPAFPAATPA